MKATIVWSVLVCFVLTVVGYFAFLAGAMKAEAGEYTAFLIVGYVLLWPTFIAGFLQVNLTGDNSISSVTLMIAQLLGYMCAGVIFHYVLNLLRKNKHKKS